MSDHTTPEDRQEVAAKLRKNSTAAHSAEEVLRITCKCTIRAAKGSKGVIEVLADLIDPTCHDFGGEKGTNGECYDFACSACGWCGDVTEPNYCPNCGARVVIPGE